MSNSSKPSGSKSVAASPLALDDLKALAGFLAESGLEEIELELSPAQGGGRVRLKRPGSAQATTTVITPPASTAATTAVPAAAPAAESNANAFTSPMVGTFYQAASPEAPAFVKVGDTVKAGQVLCIIEAMKTMNQIESDRAGTVQKVIATNGTPVEFGQPLFIIQ